MKFMSVVGDLVPTYKLLNSFEARLLTCEKRLLAPSCLSVCPNVSLQLPLNGFSWNLIPEPSIKIRQENLNLVTYMYIAYLVIFKFDIGDLLYKLLVTSILSHTDP
jgi:hypothetical protein